jgi:hypothetical protein
MTADATHITSTMTSSKYIKVTIDGNDLSTADYEVKIKIDCSVDKPEI